ncbi:hypothetical protein JD844_000308, partial [Phrynosoma platyrhinos]
FLLLWSAVLIMYPTSLAVIALTFSNYVLQPVFPNCIPPYNASRVLSMVCLSLLTWVNSTSVRWATRIQDVFTAGKLLALGLIIIVGFIQIFKGNYEELLPSNAFNFWMTPSTFGEKLLGYFSWVMPVSVALSTFGGINGYLFTSSRLDKNKNSLYAVFMSTLNVFVLLFRLCFSGAREGHLPSLLAMIHVRRCTPIPALLVCVEKLRENLVKDLQKDWSSALEPVNAKLSVLTNRISDIEDACLATVVIMLVGDTYTLINYVSFINYLCYGVTIIGLIVLRWKKPKIFRPIKVKNIGAFSMTFSWLLPMIRDHEDWYGTNVNLLVPITYLIFWAFLLIFSLYSEPVVCGIGLIIILTGVPVFFLVVYWKNKPKCVNRITESLTHLGQKVCFVVYPQGGSLEEDDLPFTHSPLPGSEKTLKK